MGSPIIPKVIHRIWVGEAEMPSEFSAYWATWHYFHPEWEFKTWTESEFLPLRNQREYELATSHAQRADIARYEILLRHGGLYVDTDFECLRPFDELCAGLHGFVGWEDDEYVGNGLIAASPDHPLLEEIVSRLPASHAARAGQPTYEQTGPRMVTRVIRTADMAPPMFKIFPASYFYPYLAHQEYRRYELFPDSYAVHHWAASWLGFKVPQQPPGPLRIRLDVDWQAPLSPSLVLAHFAKLFGSNDQAEVVVPFTDESKAKATDALPLLMELSGIDPVRSAAVHLSPEAPGSAPAWSEVASHPVSDPAGLAQALETMKLHRQRLDAYADWHARSQLEESTRILDATTRALAEAEDRARACTQELTAFRSRRLVRMIDDTWIGAAVRASNRQARRLSRAASAGVVSDDGGGPARVSS